MQKPLHLTRDGGNRFVEVSGGQQETRVSWPQAEPSPWIHRQQIDGGACAPLIQSLPIALRLKVNVAAGFLALGGDLRKKWTQAIIWWDFMIQNFA